MRKLRQGIDSLLKTTRMMCSVLRLQQLEDAVRLTHGLGPDLPLDVLSEEAAVVRTVHRVL